MRHPTTVTAATLAILITLMPQPALTAQQAARTIGPESGPTMTIDFSAIDAKGQPVTDLVAADLAIRVTNKARVVRGLQLVKRDPAAAPGVGVPERLAAPFASNVSTASTSRTVIIIFDNETMVGGREQRVRDGITSLINLLGPNDQAAILTVPHGGVSTEVTSDRGALLRAVSSLAGAAPLTESAEQSACRSALTLQAIRGVLEQRAGSDGPTDIVFVSSSVSGPRLGALSGVALGRGNIAGCDLKIDEFTKLGTAASAARAHFYIIQPEQIRVATSAGDLDSPLAGLENIASVTGATIWHMAGSDSPGFERVALESSSYYSATILLDPDDKPGVTQPLSIKTSRADVTLRARPSVTFSGGRSGSAPSPKDMLRTATIYRDTPLRVSAFVSRNTGDGKAKIVTIAESAAGNKFSAAVIGIYDSAGKLVGQWSADAAALGAPALMTAFVQNTGQYRIRVAATDTSGRAGTADFDLNATLTPASTVLTLSSMLLGTPDNAFSPKLQFTTEPQAIAYFELYGGKQGMPVSVNVELATSLNGPALMTLQPKINGSAEPDKYIVMTPISLGTLPAGDYVVRAIVGIDGQPAGRIVRTLRKTQ